MQKILRYTILILLPVILFFSALILWPNHYDVATAKKSPGSKTWNLTTGSDIVYTFLPAKGIKHPYPIIYLHGGPGAGITDKEIEAYSKIAARGYDVYLYDQVGCGSSERLSNIKDYTPWRHQHDLEEIIRIINSPKVILAGQSWGAILSLMYLADNPGRVEKLIIAAPAPVQPANKKLETTIPPDSLHLQQPFYSTKMAGEKISNLRTKIAIYLARKYDIKLLGDEEADGFATLYTTELNRSMVYDTSRAVVAKGTEGMYTHYMSIKNMGKIKDSRAVLKLSKVPVLIMKAQYDNQPWGYTQEYLDLFSNHQFTLIKNAGHNIFIEQPDEYAKIITAFLDK